MTMKSKAKPGGEVTRARVARIAARGLKSCPDEEVLSFSRMYVKTQYADGREEFRPFALTVGEVHEVCGSALTQSQDRPKKGPRR